MAVPHSGQPCREGPLPLGAANRERRFAILPSGLPATSTPAGRLSRAARYRVANDDRTSLFVAISSLPLRDVRSRFSESQTRSFLIIDADRRRPERIEARALLRICCLRRRLSLAERPA